MRYESGDRAGALSEYLAFAERLRTEMAADPMAETLAVVEVIAHGEALPDERVEVPSAAGRPPVLPFVGRRAVMDAALRAWDAVARGRGCGLFLAGESGIGKTRVARELAHAVGAVAASRWSARRARPRRFRTRVSRTRYVRRSRCSLRLSPTRASHASPRSCLSCARGSR